MIKIAFAGNPNTGKSALINAIAGSNLKVANWPGVTVEKKEAHFSWEGEQITLTDLPGIYSLTPYTIEERIARDYILEEGVDAIVDVVDTTSLERNLYLTLLLIEMEKPMVLALNIFDEFTNAGHKIDYEELGRVLGIKAIPTVATKKLVAKSIIKEAYRLAKEGSLPNAIRYKKEIEDEITKIHEKLSELPDTVTKNYSPRWLAIRLLEDDKYIIEKLGALYDQDLEGIAAQSRKKLEAFYGDDIDVIMAEARYAVITGLLKRTLKKSIINKLTLTEKIDKIVLNRFLGIPLFLGMMYLVFKFTFDGSGPFIDWVDGFIGGFIGKYIEMAIAPWAPMWLHSLVMDGIVGGVGLVLTFVPLFFFLYFFLALLEESGYMARVAFIMDRFMRGIGVRGSSFIPLVIGFGCNVPAIYATRALPTEKDRKITAMMVPMMSCGARLPVYALFTSVFFASMQAEIILLLYLLGIAVAMLLGFIADKTVFKGESSEFIIELPIYRLPTLKSLWTSIWIRTRAFVVKAGSVILVAMIVLWAVINLPPGAEPKDSILGKTARAITPVFKPAGFGEHWESVAALIPGVIAKEVIVGALGQIYGIKEPKEKAEATTFIQDVTDQLRGLKDAAVDSAIGMFGGLGQGTFGIKEQEGSILAKIREQFQDPLRAFSYMVFTLLFIPCIATLGAIKQEFGWKMMWLEMGLLIVVPYIVSVVVYQTGRAIGF